MKLLLDANVSRKLASILSDTYPGSIHASSLGSAASDGAIWTHAKSLGYIIVSKDSDFYRMSLVWGAPPKVVWLRVGNARTSQVASMLRDRHADRLMFPEDPISSIMIVQD